MCPHDGSSPVNRCRVFSEPEGEVCCLEDGEGSVEGLKGGGGRDTEVLLREQGGFRRVKDILAFSVVERTVVGYRRLEW